MPEAAESAVLDDDDREVEVLVVGQQFGGILDVRLGDQQQRLNPGVVGGHQRAVDETGPRLRVGRGDHHHQLVGVGHDGAFDRVRVVGAAAQQRLAVLDLDQPRQGVGLAGDVPDEGDEVAGHHRVAAQFPGAGRDDLAFVRGALADDGGVAAAVNGDDPSGDGVVVAGPVLGAGP